MTRDLELSLRRKGPAFPDAADLAKWAKDNADRIAWIGQIAEALDNSTLGEAPLADHLDRLIHRAERLARGGEIEGAGDLWGAEAGKAAKQALADLAAEADAAGSISDADFDDILGANLAAIDVRDPVRAHSGVMIWGTLEARVQGGGSGYSWWPQRGHLARDAATRPVAEPRHARRGGIVTAGTPCRSVSA